VDGEPVLPLVPATRIAVLGRLADTVNIGDRGSSDVWDLECRTVLEGVRDRFSDVAHDDGSDVTRAAAVAAGADVAVVVTGYTHVDEGEFIGETGTSTASLFPPADEPEVVASFRRWLDGQAPATRPARLGEGGRGAFGIGGDRSSLRLPAQDVALITAVAEANPRCVVVIQAGSAVVVSDWVHRVPAIVQAWYGGCEAGPALADVLIGDVNPSARLPFSVPADEADLPSFERDATRFTYDRWHGWWHLRRTGRRPRFAFGFGLSYTRFELDAVHILEDDDDDAGCVTVAGTVRNIGDRDGADVVQVYAELPDPGAPERLVGFARVGVAARSRADFRVAVPAGKLATRDGDRRCWVAPSGRYRFRVAHDAVDPGTSVTVDL
jgi:beta-glucosidase